MKIIETEKISVEELLKLEVGDIIKIIWFNADENRGEYGVIFGDFDSFFHRKIGWENGTTDKLMDIADSLNYNACDIYKVIKKETEPDGEENNIT